MKTFLLVKSSDSDIVRFIKKEMRSQGLTVRDMCRKTAISNTGMREIIKNTRVPNLDTFEKIIGALGYEMKLVRKEEEDEQP